MSDLLFQIGLSNACFAIVLAIVAVLVGAKAKRPHVAHLLWLLVFVKFVTPPVASIPIDLLSVQLDPVVASGDTRSSDNDPQLAFSGTVQASRLLSNTCVLFWWNPVVWWAQRSLRAMEEICCDALVIATFKPRPRTYAESILTAVELLVQPAFRPPAMASEINSGGYLERRFKMIVSNSVRRSSSRWPQAVVLFCAMMVLPMGIASAQDYDAVAKRLKKAVNQGEITQKHADIMMQALKKSADTTGKRDEKQDFSALGERIKRAVAAGKLTKEQAAAKWAELKKSSPRARFDKQDRDEKMDYEAIVKRIRWAVQEGKLTREDAAAKLAELEKSSSRARSDKQKRGEDLDREAIGRKIRAAVQAGKLTGEEARKKWEAIKKDTHDKDKGDD